MMKKKVNFLKQARQPLIDALRIDEARVKVFIANK